MTTPGRRTVLAVVGGTADQAKQVVESFGVPDGWWWHYTYGYKLTAGSSGARSLAAGERTLAFLRDHWSELGWVPAEIRKVTRELDQLSHLGVFDWDEKHARAAVHARAVVPNLVLLSDERLQPTFEQGAEVDVVVVVLDDEKRWLASGALPRVLHQFVHHGRCGLDVRRLCLLVPDPFEGAEPVGWKTQALYEALAAALGVTLVHDWHRRFGFSVSFVRPRVPVSVVVVGSSHSYPWWSQVSALRRAAERAADPWGTAAAGYAVEPTTVVRLTPEGRPAKSLSRREADLESAVQRLAELGGELKQGLLEQEQQLVAQRARQAWTSLLDQVGRVMAGARVAAAEVCKAVDEGAPDVQGAEDEVQGAEDRLTAAAQARKNVEGRVGPACDWLREVVDPDKATWSQYKERAPALHAKLTARDELRHRAKALVAGVAKLSPGEDELVVETRMLSRRLSGRVPLGYFLPAVGLALAAGFGVRWFVSGEGPVGDGVSVVLIAVLTWLGHFVWTGFPRAAAVRQTTSLAHRQLRQWRAEWREPEPATPPWMARVFEAIDLLKPPSTGGTPKAVAEGERWLAAFDAALASKSTLPGKLPDCWTPDAGDVEARAGMLRPLLAQLDSARKAEKQAKDDLVREQKRLGDLRRVLTQLGKRPGIQRVAPAELAKWDSAYAALKKELDRVGIASQPSWARPWREAVAAWLQEVGDQLERLRASQPPAGLVAEDPERPAELKLAAALARALDAVSAALFVAVAERCCDQGYYLRAVAFYEKVLEAHPSRVDVRERLAELYAQLGLPKDAAREYRRLQHHYRQAGDTDAASAAWSHVGELDPEYADAVINREIDELFGDAPDAPDDAPDDALPFAGELAAAYQDPLSFLQGAGLAWPADLRAAPAVEVVGQALARLGGLAEQLPLQDAWEQGRKVEQAFEAAWEAAPLKDGVEWEDKDEAELLALARSAGDGVERKPVCRVRVTDGDWQHTFVAVNAGELSPVHCSEKPLHAGDEGEDLEVPFSANECVKLQRLFDEQRVVFDGEAADSLPDVTFVGTHPRLTPADAGKVHKLADTLWWAFKLVGVMDPGRPRWPNTPEGVELRSRAGAMAFFLNDAAARKQLERAVSSERVFSSDSELERRLAAERETAFRLPYYDAVLDPDGPHTLAFRFDHVPPPEPEGDDGDG